ncbi:MAG: hypothetical protein V3U20_01305, partial [Thermoplasmata archaeon]
NGFERYWGGPEESYFFQWEIGIHLVIIGVLIQYVGSLLVSPKKWDKKVEKKVVEENDELIIRGYKVVMIKIFKGVANTLIIISFILMVIFMILAPLKAFYII